MTRAEIMIVHSEIGATFPLRNLTGSTNQSKTGAFPVGVLTVGERVVLAHPLCKGRTKDGAPQVFVNT